MTAPYVSRLLGDIERCTEPAGRAILTAELACYWARVGEFEEAERLRKELRQAFGDGRDIRVSILIMCVEGLLLYFRELSPAAHDRLARARLLSVASKNDDLIAITSAWLAHLYFNNNRFVEMAESIDTCLKALTQDNFAALCRVAMLLGDAHLYIGNAPDSQRWYELARSAALRLGDQAFVGALTYNRSALRVFRARVAAATRRLEVDEIRLLHGEVQSAINYQSVARLRSLEHLLATSRIGVLLLQENYDLAMQAIKTLLESGEVDPSSDQALMLRVDLVLCSASLEDLNSAARQIVEFDDIGALQDVGDQMIALASLAQASEICGLTNAALSFRARLNAVEVLQLSHVKFVANLIEPFKDVSVLD